MTTRAEELEAIRGRHEYAEQKGGDFYAPEYCEWSFSQTHRDRAFLLAEVERLTEENEKMREALIGAELAINPRDRKMLSMAIWQDRLKAATDNIFTALNRPNPWMPDGELIEGDTP